MDLSVFSIDKVEKVMDSNGGEYEDSTVIVNKTVDLSEDTVMECCNVYIDALANGMITGSGKTIRFIDSEIVINGALSECLMKYDNCRVVFEDCRISQINCDNVSSIVNICETSLGILDIINCSFMGMKGRVFQAVGTNVFMDNVDVKCLEGEFCEVEPKEEDNYKYASISVKGSRFSNIRFPKSISNQNLNRIKMEYGSFPSVFFVNEVVKAEFFDCQFKDIRIAGIRSEIIGDTRNCEVARCTFKKCLGKDNYFCIDSKYGGCDISDCIFESSRGVHIFPQYSKTSIKDCLFNRCKVDSKFGHIGILDILTNTDKENHMLVENCEFRECVVDTESDEANYGIIYITGGYVESHQKESIFIKNCSFNDCECDREICGKEKKDGFWGGTVTFYKIVY